MRRDQDMYRSSTTALLRYAQRTRAHGRYPKLFGPLLLVLGKLKMDMFSERHRLPAPNWIRTHFDEITLFIERRI